MGYDPNQPRNKGRWAHKPMSDHGTNIGLTNDDVWDRVTSADPDVRADAAHDVRITDEQMRELCSSSQPLRVKLSAMSSGHPVAQEELSKDPDPFIRWRTAVFYGTEMDPVARNVQNVIGSLSKRDITPHVTRA